MIKTNLTYEETGRFNQMIIDYINHNEGLKPFYNRFPRTESFKEQIEEKLANYSHRDELISTFRKQYILNNIQSSLISRLEKPNCYTVTTGHQLCLFTGPLYSIYKIVTTINLAKELRLAYPKSDFIPIFWMASEDHDFEEVNHANVFGKRVKWESDQTGAVGRMNLEQIDKAINELAEILGNSETSKKAIEIIKLAYQNRTNWTSATFHLINNLFGSENILILDGDDAELKQLFVPKMKKELLERTSYSSVESTNAQLVSNYSLQVTPREINLFYLDNQSRERIVKEDGVFKVNNTDLVFDEEEILRELASSPEKFSPNVILRPLYQETILPNLAYIGGGGELAYWLQLSEVFKAFDTTFPILVLRNSVLWIGKNEAKKIQNLSLTASQLFADKDALIKQLVLDQTDSEISLSKEKGEVSEIFSELALKAAEIDPTLKGMVLADEKRTLNSLDSIEKRLLKAEKDKHQNSINQLNGLFEKIFPNNSLQERYSNYFEFYLKYDNAFIDTLVQELNPLDFRFTVFTEA